MTSRVTSPVGSPVTLVTSPMTSREVTREVMRVTRDLAGDVVDEVITGQILDPPSTPLVRETACAACAAQYSTVQYSAVQCGPIMHVGYKQDLTGT